MTSNAAYRIRRPVPSVPNLGPWGGIVMVMCAAFLLGARFEYPAPPVQVPASSSTFCTRPHHCLTISLDAQNRAYVAADNAEFQTALILAVAGQHGVRFTGPQLRELRRMPFLSQDVEQLPAWLSAFTAERRRFGLGIPTSPANDQLAVYIEGSVAVSQTLYGKPSFFSIRADQRLTAARVKALIKKLQQQGVNRVELVTTVYSGL